METETDFKLELSYAPNMYQPLDVTKNGRWSDLSDGLGVLWTDDQDGLGLLANDVEDVTKVSILASLMSEYRDMGATATAAFDALRQIYNGDEPTYGELSAIPKADPLVAAADPAPMTDEMFAAFNDDTFVAVGKATPTGMYMRDSGSWQKLPDDDLRFDDTEWLPLDDAGIAKYDEKENAGTTLTRADVEVQEPQT